ncbi:MAG TPA: hypothetical protein VES39_12810, partial [Rhodospirillales bacterium]|nr:hypothetical protein [Rhodospirillales bacterium]
IDIVHRWASSPDDSGLVSDVQTRVLDGSGAPGLCRHPRWTDVTGGVDAANRPQVAVRKDLQGGYKVELEVPLSLLGSPSSDVGVAFAVVNDFATCMMPGVCDGYGLSFPGGLPFTNLDNPVQGCGASWTRPDTWAVGYFDSPPGDVYLSRSPLPWTSEDVDGLACGQVDNTYYPAAPCRLAVRVNVRNSSAAAQVRNLLYMRGDHSTGPVDWRVVDLRTGVSVPPGSSGTVFDSAETANVAGLAGHPCVRVYVLPPAFRADFPETRIRAMTSETEMAAMAAAYGLQDLHWAQQNISVAAAGTTCPYAGCAISALDAPPAAQAARPDAAPEAGSRALSDMRPSIVAAASAAPSALSKPGDRPEGGMAIVEAPGSRVLLAPKDEKRLAADHVLVSVTSFGYRDGGETATPRYNFIEVVGGIVQAVPTALLREAGTVAVNFNVGNPGDTARTLSFRTDVQAPAGFADARLAMSSFLAAPQRFAPDEVREAAAEVRPPPAEPAPEPDRWVVIVAILALLLLAIVWWWRRKRRP